MSSLVAGYASSDDEDGQPIASSSKLATSSTSAGQIPASQDAEDEEDEETLEAEARADVYGVASISAGQRPQRLNESEDQVKVSAAPDVVAVVSPLNPIRLDTCFRSY